MVKVIKTDCLGEQLTSPAFARNLEPGELFVSGTGRVIEVMGTRREAGQVIVSLRTKTSIHLDCPGAPYEMPYDINYSVDRITGSRSSNGN